MARPTHHEAGGFLAAQCFFAKELPKNGESILYSAQLSYANAPIFYRLKASR
jgi:hypothetical protein